MSRENRWILRDPGLFTPKEVEEVIPRAARVAWSEVKASMSVEEVDGLATLAKRLTPIAAKYVAERRFRYAKSPEEYRRGFEQVGLHAETLVKHLNDLSPDARWQLNSALRRAKRSAKARIEPSSSTLKGKAIITTVDQNSLPSREAVEDEELSLHRIGQMLDGLKASAETCVADEQGSGTNRENTHIQYAARKLRSLWCTLTNKKWSKNYRSASAGTANAPLDEFINPGPLFVQRVLRVIDPEITFAQIKSAMRAVDK